MWVEPSLLKNREKQEKQKKNKVTRLYKVFIGFYGFYLSFKKRLSIHTKSCRIEIIILGSLNLGLNLNYSRKLFDYKGIA